MTKSARKSALAYKAKEAGNQGRGAPSMDAPKTKDLLGTFGKLGRRAEDPVVVPEWTAFT